MGGQRQDTETHRLQLLVDSDGDREALQSMLSERYEVVISEILQPVDCYLVDDARLPQYRAAIRQLKAEAHPTFQPVLLLQRADSGGQQWHAAADTSEDPPLVDEIVTAPIDRARLYRRLENLLVRRQQSAELSERYETAQKQFERLFDATNDAILVIDPTDSRITECNPAASELVGHSRTALLGTAPDEILTAEGDRTVAAFIRSVVETGEGWTDEFVCQDRDGDRRQVEISATAFADGDRSSVLFSIRDVTERKQRERDLQLFRKAVETSGNAVIIADRTGEIQYVNPAFEAQSGYSHQELQQQDPDILRSSRGNDTDNALWETVLDGETWEAERITQRQSGELYRVEKQVSPIRNSDGEISHVVAIERDVTDRRLREQQLAVLNRILRHNLRNGINVIEGNVSLLAESITDEDAQELITAITNRAGDLAELSRKASAVRTLFDQQDPDTSVSPVEKLFAEIETELASAHPEATVLKTVTEELAVRADSRLQLALLELISYSLEYNTATAPEIRLRAVPDSGRSEAWVEISVSDDGDGIPEHEWQPIVSGDETPLEHGTGLGLWLVHWTVSLLGGEVSIERTDPGTRVVLTLPRAHPEA